MIVDNKAEYAAQVAEKLEQIAEAHPALLHNYSLAIELSNTAYFVARRLRECPPTRPPWDIIISDIYMPMPSRLPRKHVIEEGADKDRYSFDGRSWPYWKYKYSWNSDLEGEIEYGGLYLAQTIKSLKEEGKDLSTLKLVLMSRRLVGDDRARLEEYQASGRDWFKYYDKADWERENLFDWPASQLEPNIFQWALILAIAERDWEYWGDAVFEIVPDAEDFLGATLSTQMQKAATEARRIGSDPRIDTVLITGEVGTGKESIALLIHELRMKKLGLKGEFIAIDCSSIPDQQLELELFTRAEEAAGGTLFVDEVDKLAPHQQGRLYHLLKDRRLRGGHKGQALDFKAQLAICTASSRNLEELNRSGLFHDDLYLLLKGEQLDISPLRERPEDIIPLVEMTLRKNGMDITLADEASEWLKNYHWPKNARELINVIKVASRRSLTGKVTEGDLRRIVGGEAKSMATTGVTPDSEASGQEEDARQEGRAFKSKSSFKPPLSESDNVFMKEGNIWNIVYQGKHFFLKDRKGLHYIAWLLGHPGEEFHALELRALMEKLQAGAAAKEYERLDAERLAAQGMRISRAEDTDAGLDAKAKAELMQELKQLEDRLDYANQIKDAALTRQIQGEIKIIRETLAGNIGLAGRDRRDPANRAERARRAVYNSYSRSLSEIGKHHQDLWKHLHNSIRTGEFLSYQPEHLPDWKL